MTEDQWHELVRECREGPEERARLAMTRITENLTGLAKSAASRVVGRRPLPQSLDLADLVQEACAILPKVVRRYTGATPFVGYALFCMRGAVIDCLRRSSGRKGTVLDRKGPFAFPSPLDSPDGVASAELTPEQQLLDRETREELNTALAALEQAKPREALVLRLRYLEGMRQTAIAELLGVTASRCYGLEQAGKQRMHSLLTNRPSARRTITPASTERTGKREARHPVVRLPGRSGTRRRLSLSEEIRLAAQLRPAIVETEEEVQSLRHRLSRAQARTVLLKSRLARTEQRILLKSGGERMPA